MLFKLSRSTAHSFLFANSSNLWVVEKRDLTDNGKLVTYTPPACEGSHYRSLGYGCYSLRTEEPSEEDDDDDVLEALFLDDRLGLAGRRMLLLLFRCLCSALRQHWHCPSLDTA